MTKKEFFEVTEKTFAHSMEVLNKKSVYNNPEDYFLYFKRAGNIIGASEEHALYSMLAKHLISLADLCTSNKSAELEIWREKITDAINYLALLMAMEVEKLDEKDRN